jgi:REP element-mobilizing transposase RayT
MMANTYTSLHYHVIFSTKNREPWLVPDIEQRVWRFIGGITRAHKMTALQVGGVEDHIHALVIAPPTIAPFRIAQVLKGDSSKWIHEEFSTLRNFGWQDGYGAFTVRQIKYTDGDQIHSEPARASSNKNISGGVFGVSAGKSD